jgi:hypothetical protein
MSQLLLKDWLGWSFVADLDGGPVSLRGQLLFPQNAADGTSALSAPTRQARARPASSPGYQSPRRTSGRTDRGPLLFALIAPSRAMLIAVWRSQEFFLSCTSERERARHTPLPHRTLALSAHFAAEKFRRSLWIATDNSTCSSWIS